jgi:hypothetical protein
MDMAEEVVNKLKGDKICGDYYRTNFLQEQLLNITISSYSI